MLGTLVYWNRKRGFGIIEVKDKSNKLSRYFLHCSNVAICTLDEPVEGCIVAFEIGDQPKKKPTDLPMAINAEITVRRNFANTLMQAPATDGVR
jgi:cold shock CspA family protein